MMLALPNPFDPFRSVAGFLTSPFRAAAGWAWDTVVNGITDWISRGVLALLMGLWNFMDTASSPKLDAEWFSEAPSSPFKTAFAIGAAMVSLVVSLAIVRAIAAGSPGAVVRTVAHDLPIAVFSQVALVVVTAAAIDVSDGLSYWVWDQTRDDALRAMDTIALVVMAGPLAPFLGVLLMLAMIISMLFMWTVLFVREALIYLVVIFAVAFGLPAMIFPPLRDTAKKSIELLVALIVAKPVIVLALSVGVSAFGGVGATGKPGDGVGDNAAAEMGTMIVGVVTFGLAAFMPFMVWKLMPIVAAAVVAQGVASGPMRGMQQIMQMQYYGQASLGRLSGTRATGGGRTGVTPIGVGAGGMTGFAGSGSGTIVAAEAETAGAAGAAGPAGPAVAAAAGGARAATATVSNVVSATAADAATPTDAASASTRTPPPRAPDGRSSGRGRPGASS